MIERLTLNIGSGERTYKEYPQGFKCINYDARGIPNHTDVVGDVRELPWDDEYFSYLICSDIIEHFPISETYNILKEWKRVLKVGGIIEFRLPDLRAICNAYISGVNNAKVTSWLLYGAQDYPGNFHYVIFDRAWFSSILYSLGLEVIETIDSGNNFEVKARKIP